MLSHTRMGIPYEYMHMGRPIHVWANIRLSGRTYMWFKNQLHTRSSMTVFARPERFHLTKCQRFFRGRGTFWWNLLPAAVRISAQQPFSRTFYSILYNKFFDFM